MKYETTHNLSLPKLGFGTARVGGNLLPNRSRDQYYLSALRSALELGYAHFDTAELYSLGHTQLPTGARRAQYSTLLMVLGSALIQTPPLELV